MHRANSIACRQGYFSVTTSSRKKIRNNAYHLAARAVLHFGKGPRMLRLVKFDERAFKNGWKAATADASAVMTILFIGCSDFRVTVAMYSLMQGLIKALRKVLKFARFYEVRTPGGCVAHHERRLMCPAAGMLEKLLPGLDRIYYVIHDDCKYTEEARNATELVNLEQPWPRYVTGWGISPGVDDARHGLEHYENICSYPDVKARIEDGNLEVICLFIKADRTRWIFDGEKFVPYLTGTKIQRWIASLPYRWHQRRHEQKAA